MKLLSTLVANLILVALTYAIIYVGHSLYMGDDPTLLGALIAAGIGLVTYFVVSAVGAAVLVIIASLRSAGGKRYGSSSPLA